MLATSLKRSRNNVRNMAFCRSRSTGPPVVATMSKADVTG
jgi:hypothetical protein